MEKSSSATVKNVTKNVLFGFSTWILPLFLSFFATPIIVKALGNDEYGIYALILGFIGYSFNFNIGRAITKYIAEYIANDEREKINEVISATLLLNVFVGLIGLVSIILLANWFVKDIFQIEPDFQRKTINAFYISAVIIFFTMLNQVFYSILQGFQRFDVYSKVFNLQSFALLLGNMLLALSGYGLIALLFWNLVVICITCVIVGFSSKTLLNDYKFSLKIKPVTIKLVLKYSSAIIGYQVLANFLLLFERGWITRQLGAKSLTFYIVPMMLGIYIHSFISSLLIVMFPLASELENNREKLLKLYTKATKMVCFLVVFIAVTLIVLSNEFLFLWMGEEFAANSTNLLIIHTITFSLIAIHITAWQMTEGLGYPNFNCYIFSFCLIISLVLMVVLTPEYGNFGIALARLAGFSAIFLSVFYVEKWFFNKVQSSMWLKIIGVLFLAALFSGAIEKFLILQLPVNWFSFVLSAVCGGIIYLFLVWVLGFITNDEKLILKSLLKLK